MQDRDTWHARWQSALQKQHKVYFDERTREIKPQYAEYTACPSCGSDKNRLAFDKDWFHYYECDECALVFMNPRLNARATQEFYNSDANEVYNETKFYNPEATVADDEVNLANLDLIGEHRPHGGNLLEVGCAMGFFLAKAKERGYTPYGLELNRHTWEAARRRVGDTVLNEDLFDARFPAGMFDVIYMRDVIEHIPNPRPFLDELGRIARPGAVLMIDTHNIDGLIYRMVRERHTVIFGFEHPVHWSSRSIRHALGRSGFEVQDIAYASIDFRVRDILGYFGPPTFTTILPQPVGALRRTAVRGACFALNLPGIRWLDAAVVPPIANALKRGSVMKVIGRKLPGAAAGQAAS